MKLYIIILALIILVSCEKETRRVVSYYENGQPEWEIVFNSSTDTTNKTILGYYPDGTKKCVRNLKEGIEDGEQILYYPTGQIETSCQKKNGIQSGFSQAYFENGKLQAQGNYERGYRQGEWDLWDSKGEKYIRTYKQDTLHGVTKEIRTDGSVVFGQYINGKEIGEWVTKCRDSTLIMVTTYENGILQGPVKQFYATGEIYVNGYFVNGRKHGDWEIYSKSGRIDTIEVYRENKLIAFKIK